MSRVLLTSYRLLICTNKPVTWLLQLYYQIEPEVGVESIKQMALIDLFDEIAEEPLFNQLRFSNSVFQYIFMHREA